MIKVTIINSRLSLAELGTEHWVNDACIVRMNRVKHEEGYHRAHTILHLDGGSFSWELHVRETPEEILKAISTWHTGRKYD